MRKYIAVLFAATALIGFTACSDMASTEEATMNTSELEARSENIFAHARAEIGDDGWTKSQKWLSCGLIGGVPHVQLTFTSERQISLPRDPVEIASRVRDRWSEIGVDAQFAVDEQLKPVRYILSDPPYLNGLNPDGSLSQLWLGTNFANFSYTSPCVPGDIFQLQPSDSSSPTPTLTPPSSP